MPSERRSASTNAVAGPRGITASGLPCSTKNGGASRCTRWIGEAWWNGELKAGETKIVQHQLFKRNEYWFWLGSSIQNSKVSIHVYDAEGKLADVEAWAKNNVAGVRLVPANSGTYYIRVAIEESAEQPVEWAVIYAYR